MQGNAYNYMFTYFLQKSKDHNMVLKPYEVLFHQQMVTMQPLAKQTFYHLNQF